jgi:hypothetical protein
MAKHKGAAAQKTRLRYSARRYPGLQGKVVDYISHSIDDGTLCVNVCFNDKTLFSLRFACDISILSADLSDWKTGNYEMIREYMKPIPR